MRSPRPSRRFPRISFVLPAAWGALATASTIATAAPAGAVGLCGPVGSAAVVHFSTAYGTYPGVTAPGPAVTGLSIGGLSPAGCDGATVQLVMSGNPTGDPALAPTLVLSTLDSRLDPCSQKPIGVPRVVAGGALDLPLCAAGGTGGYADLHELTAMTLLVNAAQVPVVAGGPLPDGGGSGATTTTTSPGGSPPAPASGGAGAPGSISPPGAGTGSPSTGPTVPDQVLGVTTTPAAVPSPPSVPAGPLAFTGSPAGVTSEVAALAILVGWWLRRAGRRRR